MKRRHLPLATAFVLSLAFSSCIFVSIEGDLPEDAMEFDVRQSAPGVGPDGVAHLRVNEAQVD